MNAHAASFGEFQAAVREWLVACFGAERALDREERTHRFLEEALELAQAAGCTEDAAVALVRYVFSRTGGGLGEEVGGVMVTLAGVCLSHGVDLGPAAATELAGNWRRIPDIRGKAGDGRGDSALPG